MDAYSQYEAVSSRAFINEHMRRAGALPSTKGELDRIDDSLLELAARTATAEALERREELLFRAGELLLVGEEIFAVDDPQMFVLESAYGYALVESHQYQAAEEYLERAWAGLEGTLGEDSPDIVTIIISLAHAKGGLNAPTEQIRLYERALTIFEARYGNSSSEYLRLEDGIARDALKHSSDPSVEEFIAFSLDYLPLIRVAPRYPERALSRGIEGYVDLSFTVTTTGNVKDPVVLHSTSKLFDEAATRAVLKFLYRPRIMGGSPVEVPDVKTRISFMLED